MMSTETADLRTLLEELESIWRDAGVLGSLSLRPGLAEAEIREFTRELPAPLPEDAVRWFAWHDGGVADGYGPRIGASHLEFLSLSAALAQYRYLCAAATEIAEEEGLVGESALAEAGWSPSWFPLFKGLTGDVAGIECSLIERAAAPLRVVKPSDEHKDVVDAECLSDVVAGWISLYRTGVYSRSGDVWDVDWASVPTALRLFA